MTTSREKAITFTMATRKNHIYSRRQSNWFGTSSRMSDPRGGIKEDGAMSDVKVIVGGDIEDDGAAFIDAWHRAERGEPVEEHVLAFESWEGLSRVLTGERFRLLRHIHAHPEPSVSALARALGRQYRRVHADVAALEEAGLLARDGGTVRATADTIRADIRL
jgi:predicted transcriptional regulator